MIFSTDIMKHFILFFFFAFSLSVAANEPNNGGPDFKQIVEKRYEVIVHELNLDDAKAKAVRPIYMEYCQKMGELFKPHANKKPRDQRTEAEVEAEIKADFCKAKQVISLRETYYCRLRKYLTPKQILKIYDIERKEQQMIRQHNKNRQRN